MIKKRVAFFVFRRGCVRLARHSFQLRSISQSGINGRAWNRISREDASSLDQRKRRNRRLVVTLRKTMQETCWNLCFWFAEIRDAKDRRVAIDRFLPAVLRSIGDRFLRFEDAINVVVREFIVVRAPIIAVSARRDRRVDGILRVVPPVIIQPVTHCALSFSTKVMSHRGTWSLTHSNHN